MILEANILVVDDDAAVVEFLSDRLVQYGYRVASVGNGSEALDRIASEAFDLVLLDISMSGVDGFKVLRSIKNNEAYARIPVIMLTGTQTDRKMRLDCLELGADDFLIKPFDEQELMVRIRNHTRLKMLCEVEIEKERIMGALEMARAAAKDMRTLLDQILETAELIVYDREGDLPREKYFQQFKEDITTFMTLIEKLSVLDT